MIEARNLPQIEADPLARSRRDYYLTQHTNREVSMFSDNSPVLATELRSYIFGLHPDVPDFSPNLGHRYKQAMKVMDALDSRDLLVKEVLKEFEDAGKRYSDRIAYAVTPTIKSSSPDIPAPIFYNGSFFQRISLPESVSIRGLLWNSMCQEEIQKGNIDGLFLDNPLRLGVKVGAGVLLPTGNLVVELGESIARIRTRIHRNHDLEQKFGLRQEYGDEYGAGLDSWFILTHIMEKDMLKLAASLGEDMIDGMKLTPQVYAKSYGEILKIIDLNPQLGIKGVLSDGTWIYSPALKELFPSQAVSDLSGLAGTVVDIGFAEDLGLPEQVSFATHDKERQKAYEQGSYRVNVSTRFISTAEMREIVDKYSEAA